MSYGTPSDLLLRFDSNLIGQLVNDSGNKISPQECQTNAAVQAALDDATGMINAALYVAYKYTAAQIATITDESRSLLKRLCCDLAIVMICQRRGYSYDDKFPMVGLSLETLQQLRNGERVLNLAANEQAGLAASSTVSLAQQRRIGLVVSDPRVFPVNGFCGNLNDPLMR